MDIKQTLWGKSLEFTILTIEKTFFVCFSEINGEIKLTFVKPNTIDVSIRGPIKAFINLALTKNAHQSAQLGLSFQGDFDTIEAAQQLFLSLDIDWEEALSHWTGDITAHQLGQFARHAKIRSTSLLKNTAESMGDYLKEEARILPTTVEIDDFIDKVDILRADADRIEARLQKLCGEAL
jgi:ubiquinone biosynthesis protein UbiJ